MFGGTGFLGRRVVQRLLRAPEFFVRIASRHPERGRQLFGHEDLRLQSVNVDLRDEGSIAAAVDGAYGRGASCSSTQPTIRARSKNEAQRARLRPT
ncbi:NAD(P)H-binding protein [Bradyrhizobium iriomotense]|nr:NAD(P)H-binding protein [Bradyrhizobium iriomotense]